MKKRALVLSGGGSKGSWQAGVVKTLSDVYPNGFSTISGTSVGAINAAGLSMYAPEDFRSAAWWLREKWIEDGLNIWQYKFPWFICGLWSNSLGTNKALKKFLKKNLDVEKVRKSGVHLLLTAVDIETGMAVRFDEKSEDLLGAVLASSSFPVMFPMQKVKGQLLTDGGVRDIAPLSPVIDAGAEEIIVVTTANPFKPEATQIPGNVMKMLARVIDVMATEILYNDVQQCKRVNASLDDHPDKRPIDIRLIYPSRPLGDSLDFGRKLMKDQFRLGMEDAAGHFVGEL